MWVDYGLRVSASPVSALECGGQSRDRTAAAGLFRTYLISRCNNLDDADGTVGHCREASDGRIVGYELMVRRARSSRLRGPSRPLLRLEL